MCKRFEVAADEPAPRVAQREFLGWHEIPVIGKRAIEACDWLHDPNLPGRWDFQRDVSTMGYKFFIEDANVAFAFKMRWA